MSLTIPNLESLGERLREQHGPFQNQTNLFIGMMNAVVSHEDVTEVLERQSSRFKDRYLIVTPVDEDLSQCHWDGQGHQTRKLLIQKSHMFFSANSHTKAFGLGEKHPTLEEFETEFKSRKACIHGSDAHDFQTLFEPNLKRYLWIKADPTFQGLRQLLNEPKSRLNICEMPPPLELVRQNATKFLSKIEFSKTDNSTQEQNWFLGEVDLNHGLVALIGNKGSGKSALADVMALLGETRSHENFSFLRKDRFLSPKGKLGKLFRAKVTWESGATKERPLDEGPDLTAPERVKYIPQNYLETICSELKESTDTRFDQELKDVIFSHVAEADRLGKNTLEELIDYQTSETEDSILQIVKKLASLNEQIESLEEQTTADYRKKIQAQLEQRKAELEAHDAAKPTTVSKPELDPAAQAIASTASAKLADIQSRLDEIEKQLQAEKIKDSTETARIAATDRLLNRISNLERQFQTFLQDSVDDEEVLSIQLKEIVSLSIRNSSLD